MMVTAVEELSKSRSRVVVDNEFAFVLYKGELRLYHIGVGQEISEKDYDTIIEEVLPKRAKLRAMNLLTKREYTAKQLCDKLRQGQYPEEIVNEALEYVTGFHYIDDMRYALTYITDHVDARSRCRIQQDLQSRGIDRDTLARAWEEWESQGGSQDEQSMILKLLEKKQYDADNADWKERQRISAFLLRKGFSAEAIRRAMRAEDF